MRNLPPKLQRWTTKHTGGMCRVGKFLKIWDHETHSKCPLCGAHEDHLYVPRCPHPRQRSTGTTASITFSIWLVTKQTTQEIEQAILEILQEIRHLLCAFRSRPCSRPCHCCCHPLSTLHWLPRASRGPSFSQMDSSTAVLSTIHSQSYISSPLGLETVSPTDTDWVFNVGTLRFYQAFRSESSGSRSAKLTLLYIHSLT